MKKAINLLEYDPVYGIQDNVVFANNGNVVACFALTMPEIFSLSERNFEEIHTMWVQALKNLPVGTVVHRQDFFRKVTADCSKIPRNTFLSKSTHEHFKNRMVMDHRSYVFVVMSNNKALNNPSLVNPFRAPDNRTIKEMDDKYETFISSVADTVNFINNSRGFELSPLNETEILELKESWFNGQQDDYDTDTLLEKDHISGGGAFFDILAINNENCFKGEVFTSIPNGDMSTEDFSFHKGFMDGLGLDLEEDHVINTVIFLDDRQKWRKYLDKKVEELKKTLNFGSQNKVVLEKTEEILEKINRDETSRVIRGHMNVIYWSEEKQELKRIRSEINAQLKALDIRPYYPTSEIRKNYFLNSFFLHSSNLGNDDLFVTDLKHAICLFTNTTNYKSDDEGILFVDRQFNAPVLKDVWDRKKKRIKARNFAIFAPTGEGKSFLANNILRQFYEQQVRLVIIDLGGSYSKFAKLYPDDHVILKYEQGKSLGINPFYIERNDVSFPDRIEDLATFVFQLCGKMKVDKNEQVVMKKVLVKYFEEVGEGHSLQSFYEYMEQRRETIFDILEIEDRFFDINGMLLTLSEYVAGGLWEFLFKDNEDRTYRFEDKKIIIFELDEVKENKEILSVMLKLIKSAIQRTIWKDRSERGVILFDEFAKQLKFDGVLASVEYYFQAIRKYEGAIGIILQSINQLPENDTSKSMLENIQVVYALNNENGYKDLVRRFEFGSHDMNQLKSIRSNLKGTRKYTELFMKIGNESNVFRLEVPKEVYAAYLTDGKDNTRIMQLYEQTGNMEVAIKQFVNQ